MAVGALASQGSAAYLKFFSGKPIVLTFSGWLRESEPKAKVYTVVLCVKFEFSGSDSLNQPS